MKTPVIPTPELRRKAERDTILSACTGALGDVTLTDSAVIILFAAMMGAGDMFSMLTTAIMPFMNGLLLIPMAYVATRVGIHRLIVWSCAVSALGYFLIVATPFFGSWGVAIMITTLTLFAMLHSGYVACWFPILDTILTPERRGTYLSKMRFLWQLSSVAFLFAVGRMLPKEPALWQLQLALLAAAVIFSGRAFFLSRVPVFVQEKKEGFGFYDGLVTALGNKALTAYSSYLFLLNLAAFGTIPLSVLFLKNHLKAPDNIIVMISAVTFGGMLLGSILAGKIIKSWGIRTTLIAIHATFWLTNTCLFFIGTGNTFTYILITFLMLLYCFTYAAANVATTSEMMAMATPGNKTMAMAVCGSFSSIGGGLSRVISSVILGAGILAPEWTIKGMKFCHYQTLFLIYAVCILFAAMLLIIVPAVVPKGKYAYGRE